MFEEMCIPFAPRLIESMRSLGYSFPTAIADLIDNSVSAKASRIDIISLPKENPELIIIDNGTGMSKEELQEAMRYGSKNPLEDRDSKDLGRFGLGMKSASLSQCRRLIVVTKKKNEINSLSWDLDYIIEKENWVLKGFTEEEIDKFPQIEKLKELKHGTYILLQEFDRIKTSTSDIEDTMRSLLFDMSEHLSLVFHRFLDEKLKIYLNNERLESKDPFLISNTNTQVKKEIPIVLDGEKIKLKPYILPHFSKLSEKDIKKVGGKDKLKNEQGFYVYRNKRLIIWGTWFRLTRKDELSKLARVMLDIPNNLDYIWGIDIKKSSATLPDRIKKNIYGAIESSILSSEKVYTYRGRKEKKDENISYIWERIKIRDNFEYKINRDIPQIKLLEENLDKEEKVLLDKLIKHLEVSFPTSALYLDISKGKIDNSKKTFEEKNDLVLNLWKELEEELEYIKRKNKDIKLYCQEYMITEPYCNYEEIVAKLKEVIENE